MTSASSVNQLTWAYSLFFTIAEIISQNNTKQLSSSKLQEASGTNLGTRLHSRFSATKMIDCIVKQIRSWLCKEILKLSQMLSIIIDESTTVSRKSCKLLYMHTRWPLLNEDRFNFPLESIELFSLTAEHIFDKVLLCINSYGFNDDF